MLKKNFLERIYNVLIFRHKSFDFDIDKYQQPLLLLSGIWDTVKITFLSTFISSLLGLILGIILFLLQINKKKTINKIIYLIINSLINLILSIPFLLLVLLLINFFLGPYLKIYYGFKAGLFCLSLVLFANFSRNCEQVFLHINPEIYKLSYTLGANKIQFVRYFLFPEAISHLILKINSLFVSSVAYSSVLAIVGIRGIAFVAYQYGFQGLYNFENFGSSDIILVSSILLFLLIQIFHFFCIFISKKLDKS
jgi:D-methionine transport system permease protein